MAYTRINWENEPSILTPINEINLNHMDAALYDMDQNKLDKANPRATGSLAVSGGSLLANPGLGSAQFGYDSIATGYNSLAAGFTTKATGSESFTAGTHTQAASENQTAIGKYNIKDNDEKYPFIIGNGTGTDEDTSNAFTVDWDGNVEAAGEITDGNGITLSELLPTDTESGNPCVITDAFGGSCKTLSLDIAPIQDLHGYDKPWIGGAGKNKLYFFSETKTGSGTVVTPQSNGRYNWSGTNTPNAHVVEYSLSSYQLSGRYRFYVDNYTQVTQGNISIYYNDNGTTKAMSHNEVVELNNNLISIAFYTGAGKTFNYTNLGLMLIAENASTTFEPYSNICPISGISSATITRTGKNLCADVNVNSVTTAYETVLRLDMELMPSTTYAFSFVTNNGNTYYTNENLFTEIKDITGTSGRVSFVGTTKSEISKSNSAQYQAGIGWRVLKNRPTVSTNPTFTDVQVELGSTATAYAPYNGQTITRTYGQTVYGGSDDVTGSGATSEWVMKTLTVNTVGTSAAGVKYADCLQTLITDNETLSNMYEQIPYSETGADGKFKVYPTAFTIYDNRFTDVATAQGILDNCQMLYKLPTPTTISLASQNIDLLHGDNVLTSNAKTVNVSYKADIQAYIEKKIAEGSGNRSLGLNMSKSEPKEEVTEEPVEQNER